MTPLQLEARYHNLRVVLDDLKITTVDVRRYQNNDKHLKENEHWGNKAALVQKDQLVYRMKTEANKMIANAQAQAKGQTVTGGPIATESDSLLRMAGELSHLSIPEIVKQWIVPMMSVHSGKGSTDEIMICLHFVAIYGLYDKKKFGSDTAAGIRDYCDKYIGLDCNGFVGNYAKEIGTGKIPDTTIDQYVPAKKRRTKLEEVQANDVLAWTDFGHIAVIDSIGPLGVGSDGKPARDCVVVESTAGNPSKGKGTTHGGLQHSTYSIRSVNANLVFSIERPKGSSAVPLVYIAPIA